MVVGFVQRYHSAKKRDTYEEVSNKLPGRTVIGWSQSYDLGDLDLNEEDEY